jgi:hypothetical protein
MPDCRGLDGSAGRGLTITLEKTGRDRTTLEGLTQLPRTAVLAGVKPFNAKRLSNSSEVAGVCDNLEKAARKSLILNVERCPSG